MITQTLIVTLLVVATVSGHGQTLQPQANENQAIAQELRRLFDELRVALAKRDRAALERIYADDFLFVHGFEGGTIDRAAHIDRALTGSSGVTEKPVPTPALDNLKVYGDVGMLRNVVGARFVTSLFVRRNGRWQILQVQGTPQPAPREDISLDSARLRSDAGKYSQAPDGVTSIDVAENGLRISFPNKLVWTVRPMADDQFFLPQSLSLVMFHRDPNGIVQYYTVWSPNGSLIKGTRIQ